MRRLLKLNGDIECCKQAGVTYYEIFNGYSPRLNFSGYPVHRVVVMFVFTKTLDSDTINTLQKHMHLELVRYRE